MSVNRADTSFEHSHSHVHEARCVSWGGVIMGALIMVGLSFLFNILSVSLGLSAFSIADGQTAFAVTGFVILTVISIITMFIGGWVAGYLGRNHCFKRYMGELYGFAAWCLALIITILLASQVSKFLDNYSYVTARVPVVMVSPTEVKIAKPAAEVQTTTPENAASALGALGFVTFFLFGIGAISACFGGRNGMRRKCRNDLADRNR